MKFLAAACACLLSIVALASEPLQFAHQWPIELAGADGVYRMRLPAEVYPHIVRSDLGDLYVLNARDEEVPFGPIAQAIPAAAPAVAVKRALPWFAIPRSESGAAGDTISLHIARDADGRLRTLDADIAPSGSNPSADLLLDASALDRPISAIDLALDETRADNLSARVDVLGSADLTQWRSLARDQPVLVLRQGEFTLDRRRIDIGDQSVRYLLLKRIDSTEALPLTAVGAWTWEGGGSAAAAAPQRPVLELGSGTATETPGVFTYANRGPLLVERIAVTLADANAIANVVVAVRDGDNQPWIEHRRFTAFRVSVGGHSVQSQPVDVNATRARQWRVVTQPPQPRAPTLDLTWRSEEFVFLTQGDPPFRLKAGNPRLYRPAYPLETLLSAVRGSFGSDWTPQTATLGAGSVLAPVETKPARTPDHRWILWLVLILGALAVIGLVLHLLRTPQEPSVS